MHKRITLFTEFIFVFVLLIACGPLPTPPPPTNTPTPSKPIIRISQPSTAASVPHEVPVKGTLENISKDAHLWLLVLTASRDTYYPSVVPISVFENGDWEGKVYLGDGTDKYKGYKYSIIIAVADESTHQRLEEYAEEALATQNYGVGIPVIEIKEGLALYDNVEVTLE